MSFSDILGAAAQIKAAQLKARPGRREWEEAPDFFKCTAASDDELLALRTLGLDEKIEHAKKWKDVGNKLYEQDVPAAVDTYVRAISLFMWFDRGQDKSADDMPLMRALPDDDVDVPESNSTAMEARQLVSVLFANIASCMLKLERMDDAVFACNKALEHDNFNVRALYRRAEAYHRRGTSTCLEMCVKDLREAQKLEPGNAQVRAALNRYEAELREQNRKDSQTFSNMFDHGTLYDEADFDKKSPRPSGAEVEQAFRNVRNNVAKVQARQSVRRNASQQQDGFVAVLRHVPWWGWMLIVLHLLYRVFKLWRLTPRQPRSHHDHEDLEILLTPESHGGEL
mmetsp:Transcript_12441/g.26862  ORF Transcript_12441/g.26862 Transcript_12441/m.26862 type:complete len:340 (-) Transcript_12441:180-1199(-)|eukprot:CAMPEP_0202903502 /NCGR_PEP_ID=MMETSP1392-20130828/24768_1 /ASSEMBLY_ACC=CAM_ASM_000868 /TAXON_ID=225041 /ORGANISM="Chlamydomonas chlamydogama, Strain SAG 11-48b" /LENGTH=339 /DNA_ID=CAMNT_0049590719 /DNA_START=43 /DNA_END=1062 /DNA_ORIENTATION=+